MTEIRAAIDEIDHEVIRLLGRRFDYVKAASAFKTSESEVRATNRFQTMLQQRRHWAQEEGLSADAVEKMYRDLVEHFIAEELEQWRQDVEK